MKSCHDCSEGGLSVAAAEMAFAGKKGLEIDLSKVPVSEFLDDAEILFSESNSRFVVEIEAGKAKKFEAAMIGAGFARIGKVTKNELLIKGLSGRCIVREKMDNLYKAWQGRLSW